VQTVGDLQLFSQDGHRDVDTDGDPDLSLHGVGRRAVEASDTQMLLDPLEEQLHLPTLPVELTNGQGRQSELIGYEGEEPIGFRVVETDAP